MNMKVNVNKQIILNAIPSLRKVDSFQEFEPVGFRLENFILCICSEITGSICYFLSRANEKGRVTPAFLDNGARITWLQRQLFLLFLLFLLF